MKYSRPKIEDGCAAVSKIHPKNTSERREKRNAGSRPKKAEKEYYQLRERDTRVERSLRLSTGSPMSEG